jgi:Ca2+-transporting ATPase
MSSIRQVGQGVYRIYVKGSLQTIMERTTHVLDGAAVRAITDADKKKLTGFDDELASNAMRNLAFAYKDIHVFDAHMTMDQAESKLTLLGLVSMIDPPRETVPYAIAAAREAHIKIVVITGDYALTAKAIATKI